MWEGWKKNLYRLMGGTPGRFSRRSSRSFPWIALLVILLRNQISGGRVRRVCCCLLFRQTIYGSELVRNQYPFSFIIYLYTCGVSVHRSAGART